MVGNICSNCNEPNFPPRNICPHCDGKSQTQYTDRGEVVPFIENLLDTDVINEKIKEFESDCHETVIYQAPTNKAGD